MSKPIILIVDDDVTVLRTFRAALTARGCTVVCAESIEEARCALDDAQPCFALVDLMIEGGTGEHLTNEFVRGVLAPRGIEYARITSAPRLVPSDAIGALPIFDKNLWDDDFDDFCDEVCRAAGCVR